MVSEVAMRAVAEERICTVDSSRDCTMTNAPCEADPRHELQHSTSEQQEQEQQQQQQQREEQQRAEQRGRKRAPLVDVTNLAAAAGRTRGTAKRAALRPHLANSAAKHRAAAVAAAARDRLLGRRRASGSSPTASRRASPSATRAHNPRKQARHAGPKQQALEKQAGQHRARGRSPQQGGEARQASSSVQRTTSSSHPVSGLTTLRLPGATPCDGDQAQLPCESVAAALGAMACERAVAGTADAGSERCKSDSGSSSTSSNGGGGNSVSVCDTRCGTTSERGTTARAADGSRSCSGRKRSAEEAASSGERAEEEARIFRERARGEPSCVQADAGRRNGTESSCDGLASGGGLTEARGAHASAGGACDEVCRPAKQAVTDRHGSTGPPQLPPALPGTSTAPPAQTVAPAAAPQAAAPPAPGAAAAVQQSAGAGRGARGAAAARDVEASSDPQLCGRYVADIYGHLRAAEASGPRADYMEAVQVDVNSGMRAILVDWLVEVAEEYKLVPDTLYLTCAYVDSFLSCHTVPRSQLQLLGITCMLIAAKFEEIYAPQVDEFCYITDNTYTRLEVLQMESRVLNHLAFDLSKPTTKTFLRRFIRVAQSSLKDPSLKLEFLGNFFSELALTDYTCLRFKPSCLAASAVLLSKLTLFPSLPPWTPALEACSGYTAADLRGCVTSLHSLHSSHGRPPPTAVHQKYCQAKFMAVASIPLPARLPEGLFSP